MLNAVSSDSWTEATPARWRWKPRYREPLYSTPRAILETPAAAEVAAVISPYDGDTPAGQRREARAAARRAGAAEGAVGRPAEGHVARPAGPAATTMEVTFNVDVAPPASSSYFWAQQFWIDASIDHGGYLGLQTGGVIGGRDAPGPQRGPGLLGRGSGDRTGGAVLGRGAVPGGRCAGLGPQGLARSVVVVATSNSPAPLRVQAAYTATAIAEHFRDAGKNVLLVMDSVTRFAMAQREIGLATGEIGRASCREGV